MRGTIIKRASKKGVPRWGYIYCASKDRATGKWKQVAKVCFSSKREAVDALNAAILAKKEEDARVLAGQGNTLDDRTYSEYAQYWHVGTVLHGMPADATRLEHIPTNPMSDRRIILPKLRRKKVEVLDVEKLNLLLERAKNTRLYPFLVLAMGTGCRRGELLALEWDDVNFTTGVVSVSKSLEQTRAHGLMVKGTKSDEPREVDVDDDTLDALRAHRLQQEQDKAVYGEGYKDLNLVFSRPDGGGYYSPDRLGARVVELMKNVGLSGVSLHSLRHSHASIGLSNGVPLATTSERLGHASQSITLQIYSHALPTDKKAAANIWRDALAKTVKERRDSERILTVLIKKPVSL